MYVILPLLFAVILISVQLIISYFKRYGLKERLADPAIVIAARKNDLQEVLRLISKKADVNVPSYNGDTALHYAVDWQNFEMCKALLDNGADPSAPDWFRNTPMHYAALNDFEEMIKLFLECDKTDLSAENRNKMTPIALAEFYGNKHIGLIKSKMKEEK